jgi:hypothetical protein
VFEKQNISEATPNKIIKNKKMMKKNCNLKILFYICSIFKFFFILKKQVVYAACPLVKEIW